MLTTTEVTCMLTVKDLARARQFHETGRRLEPLGTRPDGKFVCRCGGTGMALFPEPEGTLAEHTALSLAVSDIRAAIAELQARGVSFAQLRPAGPRDGRACLRARIGNAGMVARLRGQHRVASREHRLSRSRARRAPTPLARVG